MRPNDVKMMEPNVSQLSQQNKKEFFIFWPKYQLITK